MEELKSNLTTTDSIQELQRKLFQKAKSQLSFCFYALYDKVYRIDVLSKAWERVKSNKGAGGVDGQTFEDIEQQGVGQFLEGSQQELKAKIYRPQPARRLYIPKPDGTKRPLSIPTIKDRVVQSALKLVMSLSLRRILRTVFMASDPIGQANKMPLRCANCLTLATKR